MSMAQRAGLGRSITGSPWFAEIVRSALPMLDGDGTIPITYKSNGLPSSNNADDARSDIAVSYLTDKLVSGAYRLRLTPPPPPLLDSWRLQVPAQRGAFQRHRHAGALLRRRRQVEPCQLVR